LVSKVCRKFNEVTSAGKLFHVRAAATANAWSPTVVSRVDGMSNVDVDDDRRPYLPPELHNLALGSCKRRIFVRDCR